MPTPEQMEAAVHAYVEAFAKGDPDLAQHLAFGMVADDFDLSYWQGMGLDHGAFSPLSVLLPHSDEEGWPCRIVPLQCGVLELPIPKARRFWNFGRSLRRAIQNYPADIKVAIAGTGGLSHQVHGERCGFNNTAWDQTFLELIENDPERLAELTQAIFEEALTVGTILHLRDHARCFRPLGATRRGRHR